MENNINTDETFEIQNKVYKNFWYKIKDNNWYRMIIGLFAGAGFGLLYWNFIGCNSGTCPLTSTPHKTIIIFTFMGIVLARKNKN